MKITIQDGKGKPINKPPYLFKGSENSMSPQEYQKWVAENELIVLDQNGLEYKEPGTYEAQKTTHWFYHDVNIESEIIEENEHKTFKKAWVYILTRNPTLEGKEEEKQKTEKSVELLAEDFIKNHKDFNNEGFSEYINGLFNGFIAGFEAKNSGLISKDAVIDLMEDFTSEQKLLNPNIAVGIEKAKTKFLLKINAL